MYSCYHKKCLIKIHRPDIIVQCMLIYCFIVIFAYYVSANSIVLKKKSVVLCIQSFYAAHIIPSESAVLNLVSSHCELITANTKYSLGPSLMMLAYSASKLLEVGASKLADSPELMQKTLDLIIPALVSNYTVNCNFLTIMLF